MDQRQFDIQDHLKCDIFAWIPGLPKYSVYPNDELIRIFESISTKIEMSYYDYKCFVTIEKILNERLFTTHQRTT